jgi:hypothetical protein
MTSEGLGEMIESDSADMCAGKISLENPISTSGNIYKYYLKYLPAIFVEGSKKKLIIKMNCCIGKQTYF